MLRKLIILLLVAVMLVGLARCGDYQPVETRLAGTGLTIQFETNKRGTVTTEDGDVYSFDFSHNGSTEDIVIIYPNGTPFVASELPFYSQTYDGDEYLSTAGLAELIRDAEPFAISHIPLGTILLALAFFAAGAVIIIAAPQIAEMHVSRYVIGGIAKPSRYAVISTRIGGAGCILCGILLLIVGFLR